VKVEVIGVVGVSGREKVTHTLDFLCAQYCDWAAQMAMICFFIPCAVTSKSASSSLVYSRTDRQLREGRENGPCSKQGRKY